MNSPAGPHQTINFPARRASWLILLLSGVALLFGGMCALMAWMLPTLRENADFARSLEELRHQITLDPQVVFGITAAIFLVYALFALPIGLLVRGGRLHWVVTALVFTCIVGLFLGLTTLRDVGSGNAGGAIVPLLLTSLHALAAWWLIAALQASAIVVRPSAMMPSPGQSFVLPPPPQPMQDYYLPVPPPAPRQAH